MSRHSRPARLRTQRDALASLAVARPARLDDGENRSARWLTVSDIITRAGDDADRLGPGSADQDAGRRWSRPDRRKLLAAMTTAAVTAIVIGVAELAGPVTGGPPPISTVTPVAAGFHPLPLRDGWHGRAEFEVSDGIVILSGAVGTSGDSVSLATLPPGARPNRPIKVVITLGKSADGELTVSPQGRLRVYSTAKNYKSVSLDGVSFALGS